MPAVGIDQVIITVADAPRVQLRRILSICEGIPVRAQMIPLMYDLPLSPPKSLGIHHDHSDLPWPRPKLASGL